MIYDLIIIGGGVAGLTAGIFAKRRNLNTLLIERAAIGGQLLLAHTIENYPGFLKISGIELAKKISEQAKNLNLEIKNEEVLAMNLKANVKEIITRENRYKGKAVIIATGGKHKKLNISEEEKFLGKGISYCASCDGPLFEKKEVAVFGSGNIAVDNALYLSEIANKVFLVYKEEKLNAEEEKQKKLLEKKNVEFISDSIVERISGANFLEKIIIRNIKTNSTKEIKVSGLFISLGMIPTLDIVKKSGIKISDNFIEVDKNQRTNIEGVFAAGDITGNIMQISKAIGEGCVAAFEAYKFVKKNNNILAECLSCYSRRNAIAGTPV